MSRTESIQTALLRRAESWSVWRSVRRTVWRLMFSVLGPHVTNGLSVATGLVGTALILYAIGGLTAAATAGVGILIATMADLPAQKHHKLQQMLPGPALGVPLFLAMQLSHQSVQQQAMVLICGSFVSFLAMAWGKRGGPVSAGMMFSMVFALAEHPPAGFIEALHRTGWFALGAGIYLVYGVVANGLLNSLYRNQLLADALKAFAGILRTQARRFDGQVHASGVMSAMLTQQAALADALQSARDLVLESPRTAPRQRRAAILMALLDARDHLLACDLDIDALARQGENATVQPALRDTLLFRARQLEKLATALLLGRGAPTKPEPYRPIPELSAPHNAALRDVIGRVATIGAEVDRMYGLAHGQIKADIAAVRETWQLFISSTTWSWLPLRSLSGWYAPTLRYALRGSLAIAIGYAVSRHLPWAAHSYWILATIVVVLRANLAQTLERRNARIAGTIFGCVLVMVILATHPEPEIVLAAIALSAAVAHAFVLRRYFITSVAATLLGLMQAHLLAADVHPVFAAAERVADTVIGALIAWGCSYVLPVWEKSSVPQLVKRALSAQARHAQLALTLGDTNTPDLQWRLARREAYDSLSALVQATARSRSEPRAVQPALEPLETLQALSYHMLAHLTAVKSLLLLRRGQLDMASAEPALAAAASTIVRALTGGEPAAPKRSKAAAADPSQVRPPDMLASDLTPWLLERLGLSQGLAAQMRAEADRSLGA
ncbi:FUSC family protein [Xylophilus sp. GOD-11R]|uniref:FUSC family protein n=1 Tax=Xylophilus sp. GOD-11R TaxID=3089814 RepID=UPI00298BD2AC|nr:FUSC family protein [Xylophilus sp. GOD-11R]WPB59045.1 FUSC family membrane protein [Xylophilus sp. GOD-11R]